jgi:hypothetical protein
MNKGTKEGTEEEINFVKMMNEKKNLNLWKILNLEPSDHLAVHILKHKFGFINQKKVKTKADAFIAKGKVPEEYLREKDFYIEEEDVEKFGLIPVDFSGISIKRTDSKRYTIMKMNPSTFQKIFGSFELGAGASIYCKNEKDLIKNNSVLTGWKTNWETFIEFFEGKCDVEIKKNNGTYQLGLTDAKKIKDYSNNTISEIIEKNEDISKFIFQGLGNFEEPFTAHFLYERSNLKKSCFIPFKVTTGSGRSRGDFTVVLKPS